MRTVGLEIKNKDWVKVDSKEMVDSPLYHLKITARFLF